MVKCPTCGKINPEGNRFCGECGTDLSNTEMYCTSCRKIHVDGEKFCTSCGTKLVTKTEYERLQMKMMEDMKRKKEKPFAVKKLSESLDDISVMILAEESSIPNWINSSKETLLNELLNKYSDIEINYRAGNIQAKKYKVYKSFFELDEQALRRLAKHNISIPKAERRQMTKEMIFEYMINKYDLDELKQKIEVAKNPPTKKQKKKAKYDRVKELFDSHPIETTDLLKEVCEELNISYSSEKDALTELCKNYSVTELRKTIKIIEEKRFKTNYDVVKELFNNHTVGADILVRDVCLHLNEPYKSHNVALITLCNYTTSELEEAIKIVEKEHAEKAKQEANVKKEPVKKKKKGFLNRIFGN